MGYSMTLETIFSETLLAQIPKKKGQEVEQKNREAEKKERKGNTYRSIFAAVAVLFKIPAQLNGPFLHTTREEGDLSYHQHGIGMRSSQSHDGDQPKTTWFNRHFFSKDGLSVQPDSWAIGRLEIVEKTRWDGKKFTILCLTPEVFVCNNRPGLTKVEVTEKVQELGYEKWNTVQIRNENAPTPSSSDETFQILSCSVPMNHEIVIKEVIPAEEPPTEV